MLNKKLEETSKVWADALNGDFGARGRMKAIVDGAPVLNESISSSDLAHTFAYVNNATLAAQYAKVTPTWTQFAKRDVFEDFKPKTQREFLWAEDVDLAENGGHPTAPGSLPTVPEATEYPSFRSTTSAKQLGLHKKGARMPFTWESVINDEWGFIQSIPGKLLEFAINTEETEAVKVLATATGPNPATFNADNGNAVDNKKLSLDSLKAAKRAIRARKVNGQYVTVNKFALVVPTTMQDDAAELLKVTQVERVEGAGTETEVRTIAATNNGDVTLVVNDWLTKIDGSANAATTWYLVPLNGSDGTRDSIVVNFLRRHERPELTIAASGQLYVGGGEVPGLEGGLRNDTSEYRVRHVVTGGYWYGSSMYASTGAV